MVHQRRASRSGVPASVRVGRDGARGSGDVHAGTGVSRQVEALSQGRHEAQGELEQTDLWICFVLMCLERNMLQCLATIATVYWRSNEESVEGEKPQKTPALESRDPVYASNSRADRVQGVC